MSFTSYTFTLRLDIPDRPGMFARIAQAIAEAGGNLGAVDLVDVREGFKTRDVTVEARDEEHQRRIVEAVRAVEGVRVINVSDRVFLVHLGGKIEVVSKVPVRTREMLATVYTPGVGRVSQAIASAPEKSFTLTIRRNCVAVVSDGSAVLGLGDLGPEAALPVMEGKAMLFKEFAGVDAFPICLRASSAQEIVECVQRIAPTFGGINLEDIAAPKCFEVEERLVRELDIPVFHDDQHGTAVVVLAALRNACELVGKELERLKVVISGAGAAGSACARILLGAGVKSIIVFDRAGPLWKGRTEHMNPAKEWIAEHTNPEGFRGTLKEALQGADVFVGLSGPGTVEASWLEAMARDAIVFALANPVPEVAPEEAQRYARVVATGRSDYPNQINNVLAFPGIFRGALDCRARGINETMKHAAADAIARCVPRGHLSEEYIVPSVFDRRVVREVARAVAKAAYASGEARRRRRRSGDLWALAE